MAKFHVMHVDVDFSKRKEISNGCFAEAVLRLCPSLLLRTNTKGDTPLHVAATAGSSRVSRSMVSSAKRVASDIENSTMDAQKQLLRVKNKHGETALHVALKNGHIDVAKFLVEEDSHLLDMADNGNVTPLFLAVERGFSSFVDHILETSSASGMNALHAAARSNIDPGFTRKLVERRPEMIKEADAIGWTPLHYSAWLGKIEITRIFLQHDTMAAYAPDKEGQCPLHLAASAGHVDIFKELVHHCPYVWEILDSKDRTALHLAVISGRRGIVDCVLEKPEFQFLLNEHDGEGNTPLHLAVIHDRHPLIWLLSQDKQVDKHAMNNNSSTAIDLFYSENKEIHFRSAIAYYSLRKYFRMKLPSEDRENEEKTGKSKRRDGRRDNAMYEVHLVVAVLVATVAFAAAFQLPGGYETDGPGKGTPVLMDKPAFKCFLVFDTIAFCFSVAAVYFVYYASRDGFHGRPVFLDTAAVLMIVSLVAMASAFVSGVYLMSAKSRGIAVVPFLMVGIFLLHALVYWFVDPRGTYIRWLEPTRQRFRYLFFKNSLFRNFVFR
ncbi:PREDICTED: protein ACCELERATED CELL DEATH 6-like [Tarenaya hassleriana]|uniref:protein ACCELERATED CELL DEATH 6-like n=1 Tax=Tarenaya hassleriana TaxID=28532 RepID=UPI00053C3B96|nr:PREDICTED: protein ACCELERATED CELL DEATH 6-like [Tarenaya hassleriana]